MDLDTFDRPQGVYDAEYATKIREKYLKNQLSSTLKMDLYNSCTNGDTAKYIEVIKSGNYPILEECSAAGYFWTGLHYASHYGHYDIIKFTLEELKDKPDKVEMVSIQSNEGMTPYAIAIMNISDLEKRRNVLQLYVDYDVININLFTCANKDIFELANSYQVLDILEPYAKED